MFKTNSSCFDFNYFKKIIVSNAVRNRALRSNTNYAPKIPPEIALQVTYRCNLRCKSCMQWSTSGFLKCNEEKYGKDLDVNIIEKVIAETENEKSSLHLWGGEPLLHHEWEMISKLLEKDKRQIVLSTNSLLIEEKIDSLLRLGANLHIVISLDGQKEANDIIRGNGTYNKIIRNLIFLNKLKGKNIFPGSIIINTVLNEHLIPSLTKYVKQIEKFNINQLILNYPWYISKVGIEIMDNYFTENFPKTNSMNNKMKSWHSFQYFIPDNHLLTLKKQLDQIQKSDIKTRLRIQPNIAPYEIKNIVNCNYPQKLIKDSYCLGTFSRMSICADGSVSACPDFPEFTVGDLSKESLKNIWNSDEYKKIREVRTNGMYPLPICFKCSLFSPNRI